MYTKLKTYNENILVPRNIEGRQNKLKQEAIKLLSQETINGNFELEEWMLDISIDLIKIKTINGYLNCAGLNLTKLPKWFAQLTVNGQFSCPYNKLETLENFPLFIKDGIWVNNNQLTSLKGCQSTVTFFNCSNNQLTSLEGCPQTVNASFNCSNNQLTSLQYGPKIVNGNYMCYDNKVKLDRPENCKIKGYFDN